MSLLDPPLRLRTFGGLVLQHRDRELAGAALQARRLAILAIIAVAGERGVTRAKLLGILWPETNEARGRQALSQALYALRRDCGTDALVLGTESLRLNPAVITSDIAELDRAVAAGDRERTATLHGGAFLDAVYVAGAPEFERWVDQQRARFAGVAERAMEHLAADADARGDHAAAATWWRRLTAIDPLRTRAALGVMEALAAAGHRAEALRHGEQFAKASREDLGAEPSAAVVALTERLRAQGGESSDPPMLGGRYVLEREIGRGGMAVVFLARDLRHGRPVAIKMLHPEASATLGRDRLAREIVVTAGLRHPHILPLFDSGESEGALFYVMPYVEGESLRSRIAREGPLPVAEATQLGREVAEALHHAHERGLIHRDMKPENVLLSEGHAVVMDFGIARRLSAANNETLTQHGLVLGTPAYMSPEQISGDADIDARSDVFALGCVIFEMLTGRPPWIAANAQSLLAKRFVEEPPPLGALRPDVPEALAKELRRALAVDPAERHPSAAALGVALREAVVPDVRPREEARTAMLPAPTSDVIGRARELETARALLARADVRLLTFTGAGGSGKTTLALQLASHVAGSFADGVRFIDLTAVSDAARVLPATADALGAREREGQAPFHAGRRMAR